MHPLLCKRNLSPGNQGSTMQGYVEGSMGSENTWDMLKVQLTGWMKGSRTSSWVSVKQWKSKQYIQMAWGISVMHEVRRAECREVHMMWFQYQDVNHWFCRKPLYGLYIVILCMIMNMEGKFYYWVPGMGEGSMGGNYEKIKTKRKWSLSVVSGVCCHYLLQRIFPTQGLNPGLPNCMQKLYHLSHQGSPKKRGSTIKSNMLNMIHYMQNIRMMHRKMYERVLYKTSTVVTPRW